MSETTAQRNARYQREFRQRNGDQIERQRAMARIVAGKVPQKKTLEKYGISPEEVNRSRRENGFEPVDFGMFHVTCRKDDCVQVPAEAPAPQTPEPEEVPVSSPALRNKARAGDKVTKLGDVRTRISMLEGEPKLDKNGEVVRKNGVIQNIEGSTVKQMRDKIDLIARTIGCAGASDDLVECLKDTDKAIAKMRERWPKDVSFKTAVGNIVSIAKYIPGFRQALGAAPLKKYRDLMLGAIKTSTDEATARTETKSVVPIKSIRAKAKEVAKKFGEASLEAIATNLQSNLVGLRDNLSGVSIAKSARDAKSRGLVNYYVPRTKSLVITKFKTSKDHEPYRFTLNESIAKAIAKSLKENPREYLIAKTGVGKMVKKAFEKVGFDGVGVNEVRHSQITDLLKKNPSEANVKRVAEQFKHSPMMTLRYYRGEDPNDG